MKKTHMGPTLSHFEMRATKMDYYFLPGNGGITHTIPFYLFLCYIYTHICILNYIYIAIHINITFTEIGRHQNLLQPSFHVFVTPHFGLSVVLLLCLGCAFCLQRRYCPRYSMSVRHWPMHDGSPYLYFAGIKQSQCFNVPEEREWRWHKD